MSRHRGGHRALHGGGGGHHPHHHHGGYAAGPWIGPGWGAWDYPRSELVVVDSGPSGPLYGSCPCPCACHDNPRLTTHTVPVAPNQACCRCPFMPRAQAMKAAKAMGLGAFDMSSVPWKPILAAAGGIGLLWWLTKGRKARR